MKCVLLKPTNNTVIDIAESTQFVLDLSSATSDQKYSVALNFVNNDKEAEILALFKSSESRHLNLETKAIHKALGTKCTTIVRSVLLEKGSTDYTGKIIIEKAAQHTSSYLDDKVLVLGNEAHNKSQPILEIEADDVKASHGATTGRIRESDLYYLTSRGLSTEEASNIIIEGFFENVLSRIVDDKIKAQVLASL